MIAILRIAMGEVILAQSSQDIHAMDLLLQFVKNEETERRKEQKDEMMAVQLVEMAAVVLETLKVDGREIWLLLLFAKSEVIVLLKEQRHETMEIRLLLMVEATSALLNQVIVEQDLLLFDRSEAMAKRKAQKYAMMEIYQVATDEIIFEVLSLDGLATAQLRLFVRNEVTESKKEQRLETIATQLEVMAEVQLVLSNPAGPALAQTHRSAKYVEMASSKEQKHATTEIYQIAMDEATLAQLKQIGFELEL